MAFHVSTMRVPASVDDAFAFLSNLENSALWDPEVEAARALTPPPVGLGSKFELVSRLARIKLVLPYEIVVYEPPSQVIFKGEMRLFRYHDDIRFHATEQGTVITYNAHLHPKGVLQLGEPIAQVMFSRISERVTERIAALLTKRA